MKRKENYVVRNVAGKFVIMPTGSESFRFQGMISTNETGAFLWEKLADDVDEAELISAVLSEYDIDEQTAGNDVREFIGSLRKADLIE